MALHKPQNPIDLRSATSATILEADRMQPQLRLPTLALDMDVGKLPTIRRVKEQAIGSDP